VTPWLDDGDVRLYLGDNLDVLRQLPDRSVHMCATSPPFYGLRSYIADGHDDKPLEIGLEETPDLWVERLVQMFREVRRVLRDDGTLWVEIGDSYAGGGGFSPDSPVNVKRREQIAAGETTDGVFGLGASQHVRNIKGRVKPTPDIKAKDMIGQPWLLAFALRADGWYLRSEIIWARPNPMPESVTDRPTKSHSTVFLLSKQPRYFFDADAIREPHQHDGRHVTTVGGRENSEQHRNGERWPGSGANARSVWTVPTQPTPFAHFATWPEALVRRMILAGTSERGCCPVCGAPWTRDVERVVENRVNGGKGENADRADGGKACNADRTYNTLGWSPSCKCAEVVVLPDVPLGVVNKPLDPVPCTVLDPFAGSATTCLVARNHGRHSIGIELNEDYLQIAAKRLQQLSLFSSPSEEMESSPAPSSTT
jgi:DNA modification methylase